MREILKQIESYLKTLRLKNVIPVYRNVAETATKNNLQYEEYLALLLEEEVKIKRENSVNTKISKAKFPYLKTLE